MGTRFLSLAVAALRPRAARAFLALLGTAGAALLVLVLLGARRSLETGVDAVAGAPGIDFWLAPNGTDNIVRASGSLGEDDAGRAAAVRGVERADPLTRGFVTVATFPPSPPRRLTLLALGVRGPGGLGSPRLLAAGRRPGGPDEVTLDRAAAHRLGIGPGARVLVADREVASGFAPLLVLVSSMSLVVAAVLVALLLQGLVEDRRSDVAVLRAMGAPAGTLALVVALHAVLLAAGGALAGSVLAPLLAALLDRFAPTVELAPRAADGAGVLLLFSLAGAAGSFGPLARLFSVEPLEAFRP